MNKNTAKPTDPIWDSRNSDEPAGNSARDDYRPNVSIWKSYVFHNGKCWFVSTIERTYDTCAGSMRGQETFVWDYDWDKGERGNLVHQASNVAEHQQICRCLIAEGDFPDEENPKTMRFCKT